MKIIAGAWTALATVSLAMPAAASAEEQRGRWGQQQQQAQGQRDGNRGGWERSRASDAGERNRGAERAAPDFRAQANRDARSNRGQSDARPSRGQSDARAYAEAARAQIEARQNDGRSNDARQGRWSRQLGGAVTDGATGSRDGRRWDGNRDQTRDGDRRWDGNRNADRRWDGNRDNDRRWDRDNNRRWDNNNRRWDNNNRRWGNNDRRWDNDRRDWRSDRRWDRQDWRRDNRYDWRSYRDRNRSHYRVGRYYSPYSSYSYRRLGIGFTLGSLFYGQNYWINDPWSYRLPEVYGPYRWVRYYDDVLLVDVYSGEVVDVIYDFFW